MLAAYAYVVAAARIDLRPVKTDPDLELALRIHNAVMPARAGSVADVLSWRKGVPERLELLALLDGEAAGEGLVAVEPHQRGRTTATLDVCVLPDRRRRGVGSALYQALSAWAREHERESLEVSIEETDSESLAFAERRGFAEIGRDSRLVLDLGTIEAPAVEPPGGVEITTYAERPELAPGMYEVALETYPDMPGNEDDLIESFEEWLAHDLGGAADRPEACFVAVAGDEVVGYAKFHLTDARPSVAIHDLTGVKRAWRGRGIARALKQAEIAWAKRAGYELLETRNELRNEPIRRLNEHFGYRETPGLVLLRGPLAYSRSGEAAGYARPMRALTVLVTASGAPGTAALVRALRENGEREMRLVGCDMSERVVGRRLCDAFSTVPPGADADFASAVHELCGRERVDIVLPQSSHDLLSLAGARCEFEIPVLVSSTATIRRANDKAECYRLLGEIGVRVPAWRLVQGRAGLVSAAEALGYPERPVCFKPVYSSGSRGFRMLDPTVDRARQLLHERPGSLAMRLEEVAELLPEEGGEELLVMELAQGSERTIDGIADGRRVVLGHPKTREAMRAGLAMYFQTLEAEALMADADRIVGVLGIEHFFNIQLVGDCVIEVNPRISTIVYQEDLNLPYLGLKRALGEISDEELAAYRSRVRPTRRALRFFDQVEWDE